MEFFPKFDILIAATCLAVHRPGSQPSRKDEPVKDTKKPTPLEEISSATAFKATANTIDTAHVNPLSAKYGQLRFLQRQLETGKIDLETFNQRFDENLRELESSIAQLSRFPRSLRESIENNGINLINPFDEGSEGNPVIDY